MAVIGFWLYSCTTDLDVNKKPNSPNFSTPALTLPVDQQSLLSLNGTTMNYLSNYIDGSWAIPSNWSNYSNTLLRYNITSNFYTSIFNSSYTDVFKNLTFVETFKTDDGFNYSAFKIIAKILKAYQFQYLVDLYGDIPYSEANLRAEALTPKYDKAETIYEDLIKELTELAELAANTPSDYVKP